jgi:hypothetical protein
MPDTGDNCPWTQERIELYVDGELEGADLEKFDRHVDSCKTCSEELSLARTVANELRSLPALSCPDRVVEKAAARVGAETVETSRAWIDRLRGWFGGHFAWAPRPAMAVMLVVIVAATVFVLSQHEQSPFSDRNEPSFTEKELELAKLDVQLAFAYLGKYSQRTGEIVRQDVITDRVVKPLGKTVVDPMYPFPRDE